MFGRIIRWVVTRPAKQQQQPPTRVPTTLGSVDAANLHILRLIQAHIGRREPCLRGCFQCPTCDAMVYWQITGGALPRIVAQCPSVSCYALSIPEMPNE